jgi:NADPH:quinone reductase-like Zn-dependent oxidoreductase
MPADAAVSPTEPSAEITVIARKPEHSELTKGPASMSRFKGKTVVVTGGASGIGEALARLVVAEGARVTIADLAEARGAHLAEELGAENAFFIRCDVGRCEPGDPRR